jgi:hypothetical protein
MKDTSLKLFVDYPYAFNQPEGPEAHQCWINFLDKVEYEGHSHDKAAELDRILDIQYNAAITNHGLRFKYETDLLMFVLRFS